MASATKKKSKLLEMNLYAFLEVASTATESEIKKAYRQKALKCHPDKNPDNPKAAELFIELSEALEILTDAQAREAYDRTLRAKELAKERTKVLDSKRRKLKENLERREQEAKEAATAARSSSFESNISAEDRLQKEIERLKKEGSRALREEQEFIRQQILREQEGKVAYIKEIRKEKQEGLETSKPRFKVRWNNSVVYDYDKLMNIFEKYGEVSALVVLKKSALVEYADQIVADQAYETEAAQSSNLKFEWVSKLDKKEPELISDSTTPLARPTVPNIIAQPQNSATSFADFEAMILRQLSVAAAAQKDVINL